MKTWVLCAVLVVAVLSAGCQTRRCPQASGLAEIRACYCALNARALEPAVADPAPVDPAAAAAVDEFDAQITALLSEDFAVFAKAGDALSSAGRRALPALLCAPAILRESAGGAQDPVDRILRLILENDYTPEERRALLADPNPIMRLYAVRSIRFRESLAEAEDVVAALGDDDFYVREEAIETLHSLRKESRTRKPRNVLYQTPILRQEREIWSWRIRWKRHGSKLFAPAVTGEGTTGPP